MPFYLAPVPVEFYLVLILFSLPLLMFVPPVVQGIAEGVRRLAIIIWTAPADVKRRILVMTLVALLLAVLVPKIVFAAHASDPCLVEMPWWYACMVGCWNQCL